MVEPRALLRLLLFTVAVACMVDTAAVAANQGKGIGVVDVQRVYRDAPRLKQYSTDLETTGRAMEDKINTRQQNLLLDPKELTELLDLKSKPNGTDKDRSRIAELADTGRARDEQLKKLNAAKDLSDAEKATQKQLTDMLQKSREAVAALTKSYKSELSSKAADLGAKAETEVSNAIKAVAVAKGLAVVLSKDVYDANVRAFVPCVVAGGVDVTDDVVAKLGLKGS